MKLKQLFMMIVFLNLLDVVTTITFLELDIASEGNPIVKFLLDSMGYFGMALTKVAFLAFLGYWLIKAKESDITRFVITGMWLMVILYIGIVAFNSIVIYSYFSGIFLI